MFRAYSEMALHYNGTSNSQHFDVESEYKVLSASLTGFKVNVTQTENSVTYHYTMFVLKNGTASWVYFSGTHSNYTTPSIAESFYFSAMSTFLIESIFSAPSALSQFTSSSFVHSSGSGTVMIGPSTVSYTNYTANVLPFTIDNCGSTSTLQQFALQTGVVQGTTGTLVTSMTISGSVTMNGSTQNYDFTLQMTSVAKA